MDSDDASNSSNNDIKTEESDTPSNSSNKNKINQYSLDDDSSKSSVASETPEKKMLQLRPIDQLLSPRVKNNPKHIKEMQTIDLLTDDDDDDDDAVIILPVVHPIAAKPEKNSSKRTEDEASSSKCTATSNSTVGKSSTISQRTSTKTRVIIKRLPKNLQPLLQKHKLKEIVDEKQIVIASIDLKKRIQNEVKHHFKLQMISTTSTNQLQIIKENHFFCRPCRRKRPTKRIRSLACHQRTMTMISCL